MKHAGALGSIRRLGFTALAVVALAACSSTGGSSATSVVSRPGFHVETLPAPGVALPQRDDARLLLEPVAIDGDSPRDAQLAAMLRQVLIEECGSAFAVVEREGPDVLRLRATLRGAGADLEGATLRAEVSRSTDDVLLLRVEEPVRSARATVGILAGSRWGDDERAFVAFAQALRAELETLLITRGAAGGR